MNTYLMWIGSTLLVINTILSLLWWVSYAKKILEWKKAEKEIHELRDKLKVQEGTVKEQRVLVEIQNKEMQKNVEEIKELNKKLKEGLDSQNEAFEIQDKTIKKQEKLFFYNMEEYERLNNGINMNLLELKSVNFQNLYEHLKKTKDPQITKHTFYNLFENLIDRLYSLSKLTLKSEEEIKLLSLTLIDLSVIIGELNENQSGIDLLKKKVRSVLKNEDRCKEWVDETSSRYPNYVTAEVKFKLEEVILGFTR